MHGAHAAGAAQVPGSTLPHDAGRDNIRAERSSSLRGASIGRSMASIPFCLLAVGLWCLPVGTDGDMAGAPKFTAPMPFHCA